MNNKLIFSIFAMITVAMTAWAEPKASTPEDGKTYYIYNVARGRYLADDGNGTATLGAGGTAVTLSVADATAGAFFMTTGSGKVSASLFGDIKTDGMGKYDHWRMEKVDGTDRYLISCRVKEANAFLYMAWSDISDRVVKTPWQPADVFYNGQWILVSESDYEEEVVVLDEQSEVYTAPATGGVATVRLKRTLTLGAWNTFCVPFDISGTQLKMAFGDDVRVAEFTACTETTLEFSSVQSVAAGTPYLIYPTKGQADGGYYEFTGVTRFMETAETVTQGMVSYTPSFVKTMAPQGAYVLRKNEVYHLPSSMAMKGFRAYFVENDTGSKISFWTLDGGTATGIDGIADGAAGTDGAVYSVGGQLVRKKAKNTDGLGRGVYIWNGKKVAF